MGLLRDAGWRGDEEQDSSTPKVSVLRGHQDLDDESSTLVCGDFLTAPGELSDRDESGHLISPATMMIPMKSVLIDFPTGGGSRQLHEPEVHG